MEALSALPEDGSSADPSSVKSEDGSPRPEGGRGSPPPNCAICLGKCRNKSFTDSCLHQFCFKCLLTWSKVKTECPLCKQNFKSIIHNVRSNHQYEEYPVQQQRREDFIEDINELVSATRFRYRTTLTLPRRETLAIQQFLMHYPLAALMNDVPSRQDRERRRSPADFRRTVYRHNLWARQLPDFTGRFRDCSPEFFRYNDSQMHRLVPWLNRELYYLLNENAGHIAYVMSRILELLPQHHINSPEFRDAMCRYFGERTEHFLHEFYCFASTPYDITGYDRNVQYQTDSRMSSVVNEVLSSSDSEGSHDSDIVMVTSSHPAAPAYVPAPAPAPGPSRPPQPSASAAAPVPVYPRNCIPPDRVIPIETLSHSDTDDDSSEVMLVGYIKPPHQRTPEVVDLVGSDSDVVLQEAVQSEPLPSADGNEGRSRSAAPLVKLTLTRQRTPPNWDSDSEDQTYTPSPLPRRKRRPRRASASSSPPSHSPTPSPAESRRTPSPADDSSPFRTPTPPPHSSSDGGTFTATSSDSSSSYDERRSRATKKRTKRRAAKEAPSQKRRRTEKRSPRQQKDKRRTEGSQDRDKRRKCKSKNGKGVKSSKRAAIATEEPAPPPVLTPPAADEPGPSGLMNGTSRKKKSAENALRRGSRESKRLRSVVNVMHHQKRGGEGSSGAGSGSTGTCESRPRRTRNSTSTASRRASSNTDSDTTDSEDNIPLQLTIPKPYRH